MIFSKVRTTLKFSVKILYSFMGLFMVDVWRFVNGDGDDDHAVVVAGELELELKSMPSTL